ncbi:MAG: amidohydrolase [Zoogloeaceae bacterium]|jgi:mannonate dehydratase|nr:amidohydrolase [Zoogloeaceae bacterium]
MKRVFSRLSRRGFLKVAAGLLATGVGAGAINEWSGARLAKPFLLNPCRSGLPESLRDSPWLARVWQGLDPAEVWDCHAHLAGTGDSDSGIVLSSQFSSPLSPAFYARRLFYMNAACASPRHGKSASVDENFVQRLLDLVAEMPAGVKLMLFAFDYFHNDAGQAEANMGGIHVPNDYARRLATAHPDAFEWVASIHPYRADAVDLLTAAAGQGARAVKWLPAAQNIDPASKRNDAFFAELARLRLPLITHCGEEKAMNADAMRYGNPLRLRRALEAGVRVVIAHCATMGEDEDFDAGNKPRPSFELFARLMDAPEWQDNLRGDISAITLRNRKPDVIKTLLTRKEWHTRLLNGSDYPLPGIVPLISPSALAAAGVLPTAAVADLEWLREYNPLYFDLALKRALKWQGNSFPAQVFATRSFFDASFRNA